MALRYEDLANRPEKRIELIGGEAYVLPNQLPENLNVGRALGRRLGGFFHDDDGGGPGNWWIFPEPDTSFGDEVLQPDFAGWKKERLLNPNQRPIPIAPDWVCEILSTNVGHDYVTKMGIYHEYKVPFYWIINARLEFRNIEVFDLRGPKPTLLNTYTDEHTEAHIPPFEEYGLNVSKLFLPRSVYEQK